MPASIQPTGPRGRWPPGLSKTAHSAGDSVSALIAEITIAADTATANWRNSSPEVPGMKATGTNTESSTSVMATIGAVISRIALRVASFTDRPGSRSEEHTSELQSLMRNSYAVFCLTTKIIRHPDDYER